MPRGVPDQREVVVLGAKRTPFGSFGGSLRRFSATDLAVFSGKAVVEAGGIEARDIDHVIFGNALQTSSDAIYLARHVGLRVGAPESTPAVTVNRLCGSGFQAVTQGAQEIQLHHAEVVLCGGTESMSQAPHVVRGARWGELRLGGAGEKFEDLLWQAFLDTHCGLTMAETAEELADRYGVTREDSDAVALRSHCRAEAAWKEGRFAGQVVPVALETKGEEELERDEHIRRDVTAQGLARLRPYFREGGRVTAGTASGLGDGSASLLLASRRFAENRGLVPLGRVVSWAYVGVDPLVMGIGPAPAIRKALDRAGLSLEEMTLVEVNEAFAPQYLAVERELDLDSERTNVDGGAIALTHPLAASGARIVTHLLHELRRRGGRFGVGSACIGGGQGGAVVVEAFEAP
jgi:acetyl-CoA acetyltransferase family protein